MLPAQARFGLPTHRNDKIARSDSVTETPWTANEPRPSTSVAGPSAYNATMERGMPDPTVAPFAPGQQHSSPRRNNASVLIHQKTPLLASTPPQVTRALAYSHPFILPLNYVAGLASWTSGDPWESFLLVCGFWFVTLYGDYFIRMAGPLVLIGIIIGGMYARKYSPLSSASWDKEGRRRADSDSQQRKTLDEILETLQSFTTRCELMLDPLIRMTEALSTQESATSQTARPTLTAMFTRILLVTPVWILLSLPPLRVVTARRTVLVIGTILLTWHSEQARASRTIIWRSRTNRTICGLVMGYNFRGTNYRNSFFVSSHAAVERILNNKGGANSDVRFTFGLYENQRRWVALGYTSNLLPAERESWTDEQLNPCADKNAFTLPDTDHEGSKWRWVPGSQWKIDTSWTDDPTPPSAKSPPSTEGWTYYDNKWRLPGRTDDWSKWTRCRRWVRDAELVEVNAADEKSRSSSSNYSQPSDGPGRPSMSPGRPSMSPADYARYDTDNMSVATASGSKRRGWFGSKRRAAEKSAIPPMPGQNLAPS